MSDAKLRLPQQDGGLFLTDGGIETVLIFQEGIALPEFAAFVLLESKEGRTSLRRYFRRYLELAAATPEAGFVLESPTRRAGVDWGAKLGYDARHFAYPNGSHDRRTAHAVARHFSSGVTMVERASGPSTRPYQLPRVHVRWSASDLA